MLKRIYISLWGIYFIAASLFFIGGLLTAKVAVVFGLLFVGMIFVGMLGLSPFHINYRKIHPRH